MKDTYVYTGSVNLSAFPLYEESSPQPTRRIKPLTGQVLLEILPADKRSAGGIEFPEHTLSPEEVQERSKKPTPPPPLTGIVREIGAWPKLKNGMAVMPEFGQGSRVIVRHNAGLPMNRGIGERFRMCLVEEVLAVVM